MSVLKVMMLIYMISSKSEAARKINTFWHISDIYWMQHFDDCSEHLVECIDKFFTHFVDKGDQLQLDFILWSNAGGQNMKFIAKRMQMHVQDIIVLPALPPVRLPASNRSLAYYQNMSESFGNWLNEAALTTFWKAGYYSQILAIPSNLQIIVLNTALFCRFHISSTLDDPAYQWTWLSTELTKAREAKRKVFLLLSAAPGVTQGLQNRMFVPKHNLQYIRMVRMYADVIRGQFAGDQEGDKFHIFYDRNEQGCNWLMLSPPFHKCTRLYFYNAETFEPLDYVQYCRHGTSWQKNYQFSNYYKVPNISVSTLELLIRRMQRDEEIFVKYALANQYSDERSIREVCRNSTCTKRQVCSIKTVDYNSYIECIAQDDTPVALYRHTNAANLVSNFFLNKFNFFSLLGTFLMYI